MFSGVLDCIYTIHAKHNMHTCVTEKQHSKEFAIMSFLFENRKHSVNNQKIDAEHKQVFAIIDGIGKLIKGKDVYTLPMEFDLLENRLDKCFKVEEDIAQAVNFDFTHHRCAHQSLLNEYQKIRGRLMIANGSWSEGEENHFINQIRDCLNHHIVHEGKGLAIALAAQYYNFNPGMHDVSEQSRRLYSSS